MSREEDFGSVSQLGANPDWEQPAPAEPDFSVETRTGVRSESDRLSANDRASTVDPQAAFFGLRRTPFDASNPRPLLSAAQEALKELAYGIRTRRGLLLLTGEAGTGKSALLGHLHDWLHEEGTPVAFVSSPPSDTAALYDVMFREFGIRSRLKANPPRLLKAWLSERSERGGTAVLVVNEAQTLPLGVLEEICMLLNLETPCEKMLQIVLAGRPELEETLRRPELYSLRQRIALRRKLSPFSPEETDQYVEERLRMAGRESGAPVFSPEAMDAIHLYSRGLPHEINSLCQRALATSYAERIRPVSAATIKKAAGEPSVEPADAPDRSLKAGAAESRLEPGARSEAALTALLARAARAVLERRALAARKQPGASPSMPSPVPAAATDTGRIETDLDLGSMAAADSEFDPDPAVAAEAPNLPCSAPFLNPASPIPEESFPVSSTALNGETSRPEEARNEAPQDAARLPSSRTAPAAVLARRTMEWIEQSLATIVQDSRVRLIVSPRQWLRQPIARVRLTVESIGKSLATIVRDSRVRLIVSPRQWLRQPIARVRLTTEWIERSLSTIVQNRRLRIAASSRWLAQLIAPMLAGLRQSLATSVRVPRRAINSAPIRSSLSQARSSLSRLSTWLREPFDPVPLLRRSIHTMQWLLPRYVHPAVRTPSHKKP
jgi:general secretion pathway protein A